MGLKPVIRRVFAPKGRRPVVKVNHRYEWLYALGFVHPESGRSLWYLLPVLNAVTFGLALTNFAQSLRISSGKRVLLVLDNAPWHKAKGLVVPPGVQLVFQPPYSPEVQPSEHLWGMVDEVVVNQNFRSLKALQRSVSAQCVRLMADLVRVRKATLFQWWPRAVSR